MSALVPIYGRPGVVAHAIVDDADLDLVSQYRWNLGEKGYACAAVYLGGGRANGQYLRLKMHRLILGLEVGNPLQGDHRNGVVLDNRRSNLRIVTHAQNAQNRKKRKVATSEYRGVHHMGPRYKNKPWRGQVRHDGKIVWTQSFSTPEEANQAVIAKRQELLPFSEEVASFQR